ncbi:MAG: CotH kinase family protein [Bacteroidaceae bacterium]|nr:CotH kinase family protein [Bacteroidaceae bacterium]
MKKSLLTPIRQLLIAALTAGALWSCQDEKPEIHFPDPIIPQKEFKHVETITPDTLTFNEGDSAVFRIRTIPVGLLSREGVTVQVSDTAGAKYKFAEIKSYKLGKDSIWNVVMNMTYGMKSGDIISIMVADADTIIYSDETVLNMIPRKAPTYYDLKIANRDSIAAFITGGQLTLHLRTAPWDLMFNDSTVILTDSLGNPVDSKYSVDSVFFQPKDSTWTVMANILDKSITKDSLYVQYAAPDTLLTAGPALVRLVNLKISAVKTGSNTVMKYDQASNTYYYCFPTQTDFSAQRFLFSHNGDKTTIGDSVLALKTYNLLDARERFTISVWCYDAHIDFNVRVYNTGLPVVKITTSAVTRRDTWVPGGTMRIELPDGTVDYEGSLSLKGRGNGTWTETNKKPYALKLDEKAKILGMHKQKRWCLLANYKDRTLLRNDISLWLARQTEMPYTVSGRFVELVWNGKHMGNYYLCEQIRIDNNRLDIAQPKLQDPANGGMLIVIDDFLDYNSSDRNDKSPMVGFRSTGSNGRYDLPYVLKDPDEDENGVLLTSSSPTFTYLKNYVKNMEDAIYGLKTNSNNSKVRQYLDYDRAIDYVLIQELTMNHDSYNTWPNHGPHSAYMYKDSCGLLCYGPVWDFDYHTYTLYNDYSNGWGGWSSNENSRLRQWELLKMDAKGNNKYYFADLAKYDPEFRSMLVERWNKYKNTWKNEFPKYVDMMADSIRLSESYNRQIWPQGGYVDVNSSYKNYQQNGDWDLTFQQAVNAVKTAFQKRWDWIDANITKLGN